MTNQLRLVRQLIPTDDCPRCGQHSENKSHLLRDCATSKDIWTNMQTFTWWEEGQKLPLTKLFIQNIKKKNLLMGKNGTLFSLLHFCKFEKTVINWFLLIFPTHFRSISRTSTYMFKRLRRLFSPFFAHPL